MDIKRIYEGGEPDVEWVDILYTQYSNYFGIQANAKGHDVNNTGVRVWGCELTSNWDYITNTGSIDMTQGYMIIKGEMVKATAVSSNNLTVSFSNPSTTVYLFASVVTTANPTGNKTFVSGDTYDTWYESRIALEYKATNTPSSYQTLIASVTVYVSSPQSDITWVIYDMEETIVRNKQATVDEMNSRNSVCDKIVTPDALYDSFNNFQITEISSTDKLTLNIPDGARWTFQIPDDVTYCSLLSAWTFGSGTGPVNLVGAHIGSTSYRNWSGTEPSKDDDEYLEWTYDPATRVLNVYWQIHPDDLSPYAYAQVLIKK